MQCVCVNMNNTLRSLLDNKMAQQVELTAKALTSEPLNHPHQSNKHSAPERFGHVGAPQGRFQAIFWFSATHLARICLASYRGHLSWSVFHEQAFCVEVTRGNGNVHSRTTHTMMMMMIIMVHVFQTGFLFLDVSALGQKCQRRKDIATHHDLRLLRQGW